MGERVDTPVEIFAFGRSGAPLSQYLQMMRHVADTYHPDIYIINIVRNDFEESFSGPGAMPYWLLFGLADDSTIVEIPPEPFETTLNGRLVRLLSSSALIRYIFFNLEGLKHLTALSNADSAPASPVEVNQPLIETLVDYTFRAYVEVAEQSGGRLLLVMDANRDLIYGDSTLLSTNFSTYATIVEANAEELGIDLVNLHEIFESDYQRNKTHFEFEKDRHWNQYGHAVVAQTLISFLLDNGWIDPSSH